VTHAIVLVEAQRDALASLGGAIADIEGVGAAYSVTGEWDFVAVLHLPRHDALADVVTHGIAGLDGVVRTKTMVAFEAFSKHDLEAMFDVGG
jgi:DNA-binding Lrp family transcriptional regulator